MFCIKICLSRKRHVDFFCEMRPRAAVPLVPSSALLLGPSKSCITIKKKLKTYSKITGYTIKYKELV